MRKKIIVKEHNLSLLTVSKTINKKHDICFLYNILNILVGYIQYFSEFKEKQKHISFQAFIHFNKSRMLSKIFKYI